MADWTQHFEEARRRREAVETMLSDPEVARDPKRYSELNREHRHLTDKVETWRRYCQTQNALGQAREMADSDDAEMAEMAQAEVEESEAALEELEHALHLLLLPPDPNDDRNVIIEIRAGTGGEEAALFAGDLLRMYSRHAETVGWRIELLSASESDLGGFKEVIFQVSGEGAYRHLKYEGGGHRVQRVPQTEAQGRIHTSAVTVAVMPEAEEVDIAIRNEEIRVDVFRSSGPGGQSVNTTDSAVRITHLPTGLVVSCQDEKSQHKNKAKALKVLRSRLLQRAEEEAAAEQSALRKSQVGSGDRSDRVRTYNFPQNRLTDHRINLTLYSLDRIMEGELETLLEPLLEQMQAERLKQAL